MVSVYLAGPEVFLPDAKAIGNYKKRLCREFGFEPLFPADNDIETMPPANDLDCRIYRANVEMMKQATFGIFNLTPFRGISADAGTAFELGYMKGMGKLCFGYTNEFDLYKDRAENADYDSYMIEDFGNSDNLMIDNALTVKMIRDNFKGVLWQLAGFETCLEIARSLIND